MRVHMLVLLAAVLLGACADPVDVSSGPAQSEDSTPGASEVPDAEADGAAGGGTVSVNDGDLGPILVDAQGRTLYLLTGDEQGASTCYDDCATNWPPLTAPVEPGEGADGALLGEVARDDGTAQATYNDWPLYYFAADAKAGDVKGQGVGGVWFVLDASGRPVKPAASEEAAGEY